MIVVVVGSLACVVGPATDEGDQDGSGTTDLVACEDLDEVQCDASTECVWRGMWRAQRSGDSCEIEEVGRCFGAEINDSAAGCGSAPGCDDTLFAAPFYSIEAEGTVLLLDMCGGTTPSGFEPCATGELSADDPPECACACALAP